MNEEEIKKEIENYYENVKWLREHVAPDDIYEFAQQTIMAAEHFLDKILKSHDTMSLFNEKQTKYWIQNILSLKSMKKDGFKGIIDISFRIEEE